MNFNKTLIALILISCSFSVHAEPTKKQTVDYILNNLVDLNNNFAKANTTLDNCLLKTHYTSDTKTGDTIVNLKKIDPSSIEYKSEGRYTTDYLTLNCTNQEKCVMRRGKHKTGKKIDENWSFFPNIATKKNKGLKVKKAFSHLIRICGGKEELF